MKVNNLATPVVSTNTPNINTANQSVAFKGFAEGLKPAKLFKLDRSGTMGSNLFILNAFVFLLGTRILTSRDKDEKREIFIRDIPSIVIAVVGVDTIQNLAEKAFNKNKGFPIMEKSTDENGKVSFSKAKYSRLKNWYVYDDKIQSGLKGFSERLDKLDGNLKTVYSYLNDSIKGKLANCTDNKSVMDAFGKDKGLEQELITALSNPKNKALQKAETYKTIPALIGFALTCSLLGIFIPKLNIHITETISKKRQQEAEAQKQTQNV